MRVLVNQWGERFNKTLNRKRSDIDKYHQMVAYIECIGSELSPTHKSWII